MVERIKKDRNRYVEEGELDERKELGGKGEKWKGNFFMVGQMAG